ncbi:hypothetical protein N0V90_005414 [Kalmusia sp. IMI 367209]|nr:hypothetical protein N0V90_005414 [Kalmusia sp. IMI 367209]
MSVLHLVFFAWKPTVSQEKIAEALDRLVLLEEKCIHPTSKKPYIKSFKAGANNSPEGLAVFTPCLYRDHPRLILTQDPCTHGFVVEFESAEDRDYYAANDPAHDEFKKFAGELLANVKVLDFEPGKY